MGVQRDTPGVMDKDAARTGCFVLYLPVSSALVAM